MDRKPPGRSKTVAKKYVPSSTSPLTSVSKDIGKDVNRSNYCSGSSGYFKRPKASTPTSTNSRNLHMQETQITDLSAIDAEPDMSKLSGVLVSLEKDSTVSSRSSKLGSIAGSKKVDAELQACDLIHARFVQSYYMDGMMKKYIANQKKDELAYASQLTLVVSELQERKNYYQSKIIEAKHLIQKKKAIEQQEKCLKMLLQSLLRAMEPYRKIANSLEATRHALKCKNVVVNEEEINKLSNWIDKTEKVLKDLLNKLNSCNLVQSSKAYEELENTLKKDLKELNQCREVVDDVQKLVMEITYLKLSKKNSS